MKTSRVSLSQLLQRQGREWAPAGVAGTPQRDVGPLVAIEEPVVSRATFRRPSKIPISDTAALDRALLNAVRGPITAAITKQYPGSEVVFLDEVTNRRLVLWRAADSMTPAQAHPVELEREEAKLKGQGYQKRNIANTVAVPFDEITVEWEAGKATNPAAWRNDPALTKPNVVLVRVQAYDVRERGAPTPLGRYPNVTRLAAGTVRAPNVTGLCSPQLRHNYERTNPATGEIERVAIRTTVDHGKVLEGPTVVGPTKMIPMGEYLKTIPR